MISEFQNYFRYLFQSTFMLANILQVRITWSVGHIMLYNFLDRFRNLCVKVYQFPPYKNSIAKEKPVSGLHLPDYPKAYLCYFLSKQ